MTIQRGLGVILSVGSLFLGACTRGDQQQATPGQTVAQETPQATIKMPTSINAVMVALIDHAAHELWDVEKAAPKTDVDWREVEHHAMQLLAADALLRVGGNGPMDEAWVHASGWAEQTQRHTDAARAATDAVRSKNLQGLIAANGRLVEACEGCHKQFKPDLPSEGIVHPH